MKNQEIDCQAQHGPEQKICPRCGAVYPLEVGSDFGPYKIRSVVSQQPHLNTYQLGYEEDVFLLQEYRDHLLADYREALDVELNAVESAVFVRPLQRMVDTQTNKASLVYYVYPYEENSLSLDDVIRRYGFLNEEVMHRIVSDVLDAFETYDAHQFVHNHINSLSLQLTSDGPRFYHQFYTDRWGEKQLLSTHINFGFSPPEQIRTGIVFRETDRYGLAMILFHMLTGLTPTLWYPDVPSLNRFRYYLKPQIIQFYANLLEPSAQFTWADLKKQWADLKDKLPDNRRFSEEVKRFYQAVEAFENHQFASAFPSFDELYRQSELHNPHVVRYLGKLCWQTGKKREGALFYGEACRRESLGVFYYELAQYFYEDGAYDRATLALKSAVKRIPYDSRAYTFIAQILFEQEKYKDAEMWLVESLRLKPSSDATRILHQIRAKIAPSNHVHTMTDAAAFSYKRTEAVPWDQAAKFVNFVNTELLPLQSKIYDKYEVVNAIGKNAKGVTTYIVENAEGEQFWTKGFPLNFRGRYRWEREAKNVKQLDHKNIPVLVDFFEADDYGYLVYQKIEGLSLESFMEEGRLFSYQQIEKIFADIFSAIAYLNTAYIIHADIKPANIVWDMDAECAYLVDFDVSVDLQNTETQRKAAGVSMEYAPPEQKRTRQVNFTTDLYALCTTLIYAASGLDPNHFYYHAPKIFQDFELFIPFSQRFKSILKGVLSDDSEDRLPSCQLLLKTFSLENDIPIFDSEKEVQFLALRETIAQLKMTQDFSEISGLIQTLLNRQRSHITLFVAGDRLARIQRHQEAQKYFEESILRNPAWLYAYYGLARILIKEGSYKQAIALLEKAVQKAPQAAYSYNLIAESYQVLNDFSSAILFFDKALATDPKNLEITIRLAKLHAALNHFELARGYCDKALEIHVLEDRAYHILQNICATYGQLDKALEYGLRAVSLKPRKAEYHYDYGISLYRLQQFDTAVEAFQQSLTLKPELVDAHYFLANCFLSLKQPDKALIHLYEVEKTGKEQALIRELITIANKELNTIA